MRQYILPFALLLASLHPLGAQTPDNLIGLTRNAPIIAQQDHLPCAARPFCPAAGMPPAAPLPPFVGGTAWDPRQRQVWVSNGQLLAAYDMNGCAPNCPPMPCPTSSPNALCTGLAFVESLNQLWILDSQGVILQCTPSCPPAVIAQCTTGLLPGINAATSGLAVDEGKGLVFYSYTNFTTGVSTFHVAYQTAPCQFWFVQTVGPCVPGMVFGPVTGLAVDWCQSLLYLTDGLQTQSLNYTLGAGGTFMTAIGTCCTWTGTGPIPDPVIGLCVRPGHATTMGPPCANGVCPPCPMQHRLRNDPNLGNLAFTIGLDGAPTGALAWCLIGFGGCAGPGVIVPPLCGPILTPPGGALPPQLIAGAGACGGTANFPMPLPVISGLCGAVLSSQCIVICPGGGIGTSMSPCLSWRLQGS